MVVWLLNAPHSQQRLGLKNELTSGESRFPFRSLSSSSTRCLSSESFSCRRFEISCRICWESWALLLRRRPFLSLSSCSSVSMRPVSVTKSLLKAWAKDWLSNLDYKPAARVNWSCLCLWIPDWSGASWSPGRCVPAAKLLSWPGFPLVSSVLLPDPPALSSDLELAPFPHPASAFVPQSSALAGSRHKIRQPPLFITT